MTSFRSEIVEGAFDLGKRLESGLDEISNCCNGSFDILRMSAPHTEGAPPVSLISLLRCTKAIGVHGGFDAKDDFESAAGA